MRCEMRRRGIVFLGAIVSIGLLNSVALAAHHERFKENCSGAFVTAQFSFDGSGNAGQYTASCRTSMGRALKTGVSQSATNVTGICTAPDGTAGTQYNLLERFDSVTFEKDGSQLFSFSNSGTECYSNTTNVFSKTESWTINGGTGKFKNATGNGTESINGITIDKPASPGFGTFGAEQTNSIGTISW